MSVLDIHYDLLVGISNALGIDAHCKNVRACIALVESRDGKIITLIIFAN